LFTGIVEELGNVRLIRPDRLTVKAAKVLADIGLGASIAVNGTCLTVTDFTADSSQSAFNRKLYAAPTSVF